MKGSERHCGGLAQVCRSYDFLPLGGSLKASSWPVRWRPQGENLTAHLHGTQFCVFVHVAVVGTQRPLHQRQTIPRRAKLNRGIVPSSNVLGWTWASNVMSS